MSEQTTDAGTMSPAGVNPTTFSEASHRLAEKWKVTGNSRDTAQESQGSDDPGVNDDTHPRDDTTDLRGESEQFLGEDNSEDGAEGLIGEGTDEGDPAYFTSVDDLVEAAGYGKNEFMQHLRVPVKDAEGNPVEVNLHELVQGYQRGRNHQEQMQQVEQAREQLQTQDAQLRQRWEQQFESLRADTAVATAHFDDQEKAIDDHFNSLDWAQMRVQAPSEAALLQADWDRAKKQVQTNRDKLRQEYVEAARRHQAMQQHQQQQNLAEQRKRLTKLRPEWSDKERRETDGRAISEYLSGTYGLTPQELAGLHDARALDMAYKAMQYDKARTGAKETGERVKQQGNLLRPGASQKNLATGRAPTLRRQARDSQTRLKRTGKQKDATAALAARWEASGTRR